ncbi:kinase-like protein [Trametes elegans]|nr:kinase-like protein [Trametes elegans]
MLTWRIGDSLSCLAWALWRCFPSSLRLAFYQWLEDHYGDASYGIRIRMLPFGLVSKGGIGSPYIEADNIRFVAKNTSIPVPRILDVIEYIDTPLSLGEPRGIIIMTRIEGESLGKWMSDRAIRAPGELPLLEKLDLCINTGNIAGITETMALLKARSFPPPKLDLSDAASLIGDLRNAFRELRSLVPPSGAVTGLSGRPLKCNRAGECKLIGPFKDQLEFKEAIFAQASGFRYRHRIPALRRLAAPVHAKQHRVLFTHADLAARNILIKDGRLAGIIDWEFSGWYPEYWELVAMENQMRGETLAYQFWDTVQLFGPEPYRDELRLEWVLWSSTGTFAVADESGDSLSCPRYA